MGWKDVGVLPLEYGRISEGNDNSRGCAAGCDFDACGRQTDSQEPGISWKYRRDCRDCHQHSDPTRDLVQAEITYIKMSLQSGLNRYACGF